MKRILRIIKAIAAIVLIAWGIGFLAMPNRKEQLRSFVGPGVIIESKHEVVGLSSTYWARYRCDPARVREFIKRHRYESATPETESLREKFPFTHWPANMGTYDRNWIKYEVDHWFIIVAFPRDESKEILYIRWSM